MSINIEYVFPDSYTMLNLSRVAMDIGLGSRIYMASSCVRSIA